MVEPKIENCKSLQLLDHILLPIFRNPVLFSNLILNREQLPPLHGSIVKIVVLDAISIGFHCQSYCVGIGSSRKAVLASCTLSDKYFPFHNTENCCLIPQKFKTLKIIILWFKGTCSSVIAYQSVACVFPNKSGPTHAPNTTKAFKTLCYHYSEKAQQL